MGLTFPRYKQYTPYFSQFWWDFYYIKNKEKITAFLDTKIESREEVSDKKWITTWNHYLNRIKPFFRWLYDTRCKEVNSENTLSWVGNPVFVKIKAKKTNILIQYLETELWDRYEILFIVKYEPHVRNKAVLTLFWDLGARYCIFMLVISSSNFATFTYFVIIGRS